MLKLFNKDGVEVLPDEKISNGIGGDRIFVSLIDKHTLTVRNHRKYWNTWVGHYPNYHIVDVPTMAELEAKRIAESGDCWKDPSFYPEIKLQDLAPIAVPVGTIPNDVVVSFKTNELRMDRPFISEDFVNAVAVDIGKMLDAEPQYIQQCGRADRLKLYTPLSEALLKFFDAGYTAHRYFDHDRATVRSVHFKRGSKVPLIAHIEIIDGNRYIRNSIFNMIS